MWYLILILSYQLVAGFSNVGTNFYVAVPPTYDNTSSGTCTLYFNAFQQTQVSLITTRTGVFESFHLSPLETYAHFVYCSERVPNGTANYAIRIVASQPVSVQLHTDYDRGDMITLFPEIEDEHSSYDYYLHTLIENTCTTSSYFDAAFTLASSYGDIVVTIYDAPVGGNVMSSFIMNAFQTYCDLRRCNTNHDFTGWRVSTTSPVSVTTGNLYSFPDHSTTSSRADYALFRVLDARMLNTEYIIPPIEWPSAPSTATINYVRIISFDDDNLIAVIDNLNAPIIAKIMSQNEVFEYHVPNGRDAYIVRCAMNCSVIAYPNRISDTSTGALLFHLPSSQRGTDQAIFNRIHSTTMVTIVSNTRHVFYNGEVITTPNWKDMVGNDLYYTSMAITTAGAQIVTSNEHGASFQCYLHGRLASNSYQWYGDVVGVGEIPLTAGNFISDDRMDNLRKEAPIGI